LHGETSTSQLAVGAHQGHLTAAAGISAPVACSACHVVPTAVDSPGHLDGDMIAEVTLPGWDRASATCSNTYCHGPATPMWTDATGPGDACGSCHGIPPSTYHDPSLTLHDCTTCHPDIDGNGNFVIPSEHINGQVDLR
jgi:predicted CxxxxCH...CXXCH cytochrome family protein